MSDESLACAKTIKELVEESRRGRIYDLADGGLCPVYNDDLDAMCLYDCWTGPECITEEPVGGWTSQKLRITVRSFWRAKRIYDEHSRA